MLEPDGETIQCAGSCFYRPWLSDYRQHGKGIPVSGLDGLETARFDYIAGASLFIPVAIFRNGLAPPRNRRAHPGSSWLNEEFSLYFEELDLAKRLRPGLEMA